ncbi:SacI homology domain-containing protein [Phycomyces blakesleeanus]|uniref:SacI homology domain-containing protein n=1 Tax=Phycomyces blakesleeanus TaxID=4837 RepID=A0ABR3B6P1_PHYBL
MLEQFGLHISHDTYCFTPLYEPAKEGIASTPLDTLTVHRNSGLLELNAPQALERSQNELTVYGLLGFIQLQAGEYMIVITGRARIGSLCGSDIYRATTFQILHVPHTMPALTKQQMETEQMFINLLEDHLKQNSFYFSYKYHLTLTIQQQAALGQNSRSQWEEADTRFFSNRFLMEKLINATQHKTNPQDLSAFILPVIQGFVAIVSSVIQRRQVVFGLISRRSLERDGTRYFSRGLDIKGHASNFVETEQILLCDLPQSLSTTEHPLQFSFVQTRGSMPARWGQIPNTRYTPQLWLNNDLSNLDVLDISRTHFDQQIEHYGSQVLVNLVNKKGYELPVGELYRSIVEKLANPRLFYVHFDFHHECRKMRWNRVQLLLDMLEPELRKQSYCFYDATTPVLKKRQTSVVRTNCMDCLDRTNVVQSALAHWVLDLQLREANVLQSTEVVENDEAFISIFKNVWADNADVLSIAYSGTGALKTDYTRTGKRSYAGALSDLSNSILRYIKNNYMDGSRQDAIDLYLGNYRVGKGQLDINTSGKSWQIRVIPPAFFLSFATFVFALFFPSHLAIESSLLYLFLLSFCFAIVLVTWRFIQLHGSEFVNWPKLIQLPTSPEYISRPVAASRWTVTRSNTGLLEEAEEGQEMTSIKKKT